MATHSSIPAWGILSGYSPWGRKESNTTEQLHFHFLSLRYDLNQIPYDYTVDVKNRFKGLDLVDRVPEQLWTVLCSTVQEVVTRTIPKKKNCKKAK